MSVEERILAELAPSDELTAEERQARGRLIEWLLDPEVNAVDAIHRLSRSHDVAYQRGREDGRREMFERYCGPRPKPHPKKDTALSSFLRRVK